MPTENSAVEITRIIINIIISIIIIIIIHFHNITQKTRRRSRRIKAGGGAKKKGTVLKDGAGLRSNSTDAVYKKLNIRKKLFYTKKKQSVFFSFIFF